MAAAWLERPTPKRLRELVTAPFVAAALVAAGLSWAYLAAMDPARPWGGVCGPILAGLGLLHRRLCRRSLHGLVLPSLMAAALGIGSLSHPDLNRGDFAGYYSYLRSLAFDHDLDFANEWEHWRLPEKPVTATGLRSNQYTVGPPLLWSPFFAVSHVYVVLDRAFGSGRYGAHGYSEPYLRCTLTGTIVVSTLACWLLGKLLARQLPMRVVVLAVIGAVVTTPVVFYIFVQPGMAHGATFSVAALVLWAWDRARIEPSLRSWAWLGALVGVLVMMRLQAVVFVLPVALLAVAGLAGKTVKPLWVVAGVAAAALAFLPQLIAWKVLYGEFLRVPAGSDLRAWSSTGGWFEPSSPRLLQVLLSADHGLLTWTPGALLGLVGLAAGLGRWRLLSIGGLLVFLATAWINGSIADWAGSDAFGARRFDLVVPFIAVGYGTLLSVLARAPLLTPALVLAALAIWNVGLVRLWRYNAFPHAAPLERAAQLQARQLGALTQNGLARWGGARGRAIGYDSIVGRYFFWNTNYDGRIDLGAVEQPFLGVGWSPPQNAQGPPLFRGALYPESCVRVPLLKPVDLRAVIAGRAARGIPFQVVAVALNGLVLAQSALKPDWNEIEVELPAQLLVQGENSLCLRFAEPPPVNEGPRIAAEVREIRVH